MLANHVFWWLMLFYIHLLLLLQPSVLRLSVVTFNDDAKSPPKWILHEFDVALIRSRLGRHLEMFTWQNWPRLRGLPGVADRATRIGWSPRISVNVIKLKWEIIWTGGLPHLSKLPPPPPCKQALRVTEKCATIRAKKELSSQGKHRAKLHHPKFRHWTGISKK